MCAASDPRGDELRPEPGRGDELVAMIDKALASGVDVTTDTYPYLPGATTLAAILPSWTPRAGRTRCSRAPRSVRASTHHLRARAGRRTAATAASSNGTRSRSAASAPGAVRRGRADRRGSRSAPGSRPRDFFEILLADDLATSILQHVGHEENARDHAAPVAHGRLGRDPVGGKPHPRSWGTFAVPAHYVRELGVLDLADCIHHLTGRPARRLRLPDRGLRARGTPPTWSCSTRLPCGTPPRSPSRPGRRHPVRVRQRRSRHRRPH